MIDHVRPTARIPAVQGQFGPRLLSYTTQLPPGSIETIIGHDPRSRHWKRLPDDLAHIYQHLQRATTKSRLDAILRYIRYRFLERPIILGAFPAISIAVQNPTEFERYDTADSGVGVLHFDLSKRNRRIIVDGLGRASAALELVEMAENSDLSEDVRAGLESLIAQFTLPAVFFVPAQGTAPLSLEEMQQLFHDFNFRVAKVKEKDAIALDHSDLYIGLTNRLGDSALLKSHGGMERKAASLGSKSTAVVVQPWLLRFVRAATEGEGFAEGASNTELASPSLTEETLGLYEQRLLEFLGGFAGAMGAEQFQNRENLHLTAPGWATLGVVFHDLNDKLKVSDLDAFAHRLGRIDWNRLAPEWSEIVKEKVNKQGEVVLGLVGGGGGQNRRLMTAKVRELLGIDVALREKGLLGEGGASPHLLSSLDVD